MKQFISLKPAAKAPAYSPRIGCTYNVYKSIKYIQFFSIKIKFLVCAKESEKKQWMKLCVDAGLFLAEQSFVCLPANSGNR